MATKTPSKKSLMIPNSQWRVMEDVEIRHWAEPGGSNGMGSAKSRAVKVLTATIPAGTVLTVIGKFTAFSILGEGITFPAQTTDALIKHDFGALRDEFNYSVGAPGYRFHPRYQGIQLWPETDDKGVTYIELPYAELAPYLEQVGEPERQTFWVIRDAATGEYYRTTRWLGYMTDAKTNCTINVTPGWKPRQGYPYEMEKTTGKAKKHTDLGKIKTTIMNFTGYFAGLDRVETKDWLERDRTSSGDDTWPFIDTLEAVQIDKMTKEEIQVIPLAPWRERSLRLRRLTAEFGSSVRKVFDDLDKKGVLADFPYMIAFRNPKGFTDVQVADIEAAVKTSGIKGKKAKDVNSYAIAAKSFSPVLATALSSQGIEGKIISTSTLEEATA
jgi:hypothetical protein